MFNETQMFMHSTTGAVDDIGNWLCDISYEELTPELPNYRDVMKSYIDARIFIEVVKVNNEWVQVK